MIMFETATAEDATEILALQHLAYLSEAAIYDDYQIPPLTQTLEDTLADFRDRVVLKASIGRKIIGSVRGHESQGTCYVGKLIVNPDHQNQGLGARLMAEIETAFGYVGRFELFTGHLSEKTLHLYQNLGYRPFRRETITPTLTLVYLEKTVQ